MRPGILIFRPMFDEAAYREDDKVREIRFRYFVPRALKASSPTPYTCRPPAKLLYVGIFMNIFDFSRCRCAARGACARFFI